jgi:predicted DNA-binding ArsR family transcriptional regulator
MDIIYDFYLFLLKKINMIEETWLVTCIGFRSIDFEEFYKKYFEEKIKDFDEFSLKKLSKIISLMKKEYKILEKQQVDTSEKIAWLEDALYILKKHIENICKYKRVVGNEKK